MVVPDSGAANCETLESGSIADREALNRNDMRRADVENPKNRRALCARDREQIGARADDADVFVNEEFAARKENRCRAAEIERDGVAVIHVGERLTQRA